MCRVGCDDEISNPLNVWLSCSPCSMLLHILRHCRLYFFFPLSPRCGHDDKLDQFLIGELNLCFLYSNV